MSRRAVHRVVITIYDDDALSVEGLVGDPAWCLAVMDNARDTVKNHINRKREIIVPNRDVSLPDLKA